MRDIGNLSSLLRRFGCVAFAIAVCTSIATAERPPGWTEFRGVGGQSSAPAAEIPIEWDIESGRNVAWQAELPGRGVSGPIVVGNRVFVTASGGLNRTRLDVLAFDADTGQQLWHRRSWATGRTLCHPTSANAAPTPASDGERIFAFYSSNDLLCYDLDGNLLWYRPLVLDHARLGNDVGMSASPVVADGAVVVQCECQQDSFAAAIDCQTGQTRWEVKRPKKANWCSPVVMQFAVDGTMVPAVLLQSSEGTNVYAMSDGRELWSSSLAGGVIPSPTASDSFVLLPGNGVTALRANTAGEAEQVWANGDLKAGNASPMLTEAGLCIMNRAGVLSLADPTTGEELWKKRIGGSYWATPVAVGTRLYALDDRGNVNVVDLADRGKVIARNSLGEEEATLGSPAVVGNALYIRSHDYLWKITSTE